MPVPVDEFVRAAFAPRDPGGACRRALEALRGTLGAERAMLARGRRGSARALVVYQSPEPIEGRCEELSLPVPAADEPVEVDSADQAAMLPLGLQPRDDACWWLAVVRPRSRPWGAADREILDRAAPRFARLLDDAIAQQRLAETGAEPPTWAAQERFMNHLAHELRNPLAPILMWTSTLKRLRKDDADVLRAAQAIEHAVALERRLIEDLLDVSRLERGMLTLRRERVNLAELVRATTELHRAPAEDGQVTLAVEVPGEPVPVEGDPDRLAQLIGNLVRNAVKFTPADGRIVVRLARQGDQAEITVSDTGAGVPGEVQPQLFTPFAQGPNARGGLGVGLAVTRWLVELHGGRVESVAPGDQGGATFRLTLPLKTTGSRAATR